MECNATPFIKDPKYPSVREEVSFVRWCGVTQFTAALHLLTFSVANHFGLKKRQRYNWMYVNGYSVFTFYKLHHHCGTGY